MIIYHDAGQNLAIHREKDISLITFAVNLSVFCDVRNLFRSNYAKEYYNSPKCPKCIRGIINHIYLVLASCL